MLYNLEPDRTVTGGAWYQDQDFEAEFVDVLNQQCLRFLQLNRENAEKKREGPLALKRLSCCSVKEVHKFISDLGISKVRNLGIYIHRKIKRIILQLFSLGSFR